MKPLHTFTRPKALALPLVPTLVPILIRVLILAAFATAPSVVSAQNTRSNVAEVQTHLTYLGYKPAGIDGRMGGGTRSAIRQFQLQNGLPVTGLPDRETRKALTQTVNSKLAANFGKQLHGEYGTAAGCRIPSARLRIDGLHVFHKPTWADSQFEYMLYPTGGDGFRIQWDKAAKQTGKPVRYDAARNAFRVPEMQMIALSKCPATEPGGETPQHAENSPVPQTLYDTVAKDMDLLQQKLNEAEALRLRLKNRLERISSRSGSLLATVRSLEANLKNAQTEAKGLRTRLGKTNATVKDLRKRIIALADERDTLLHENGQLVNAQSGQNDRRNARLRTANAALRRENRQLRALLEEAGLEQPGLEQQGTNRPDNTRQQQNTRGIQFQTKDGRFRFSLGGR